MKDHDEKWEERVNALLDGELSPAEADLLKRKAASDADLARVIIDACRLQQAIDAVPVEHAPARLRRRLRAVPRRQGAQAQAGLIWPRWALAAVALAAIVIGLTGPDRPSDSELAQARKDMAIAFAYLDRAGAITAREIGPGVGGRLADAVTGSLDRAIGEQRSTAEEKKT